MTISLFPAIARALPTGRIGDILTAERRRGARSTTVLWFGTIEAGGTARRGRIRNIARDGLMGEVDLPLARGDKVTVGVRGFGTLVGRVRWARKGRFGLRFDHPVEVEEVFAAQVRQIVTDRGGSLDRHV